MLGEDYTKVNIIAAAAAGPVPAQPTDQEQNS